MSELERLTDETPPLSRRPLEVRALRGRPAHALASEAERLGDTLLVIGAGEPRTGLRRMTGSVRRDLTENPNEIVAVVPGAPVPAEPRWRAVVALDGSDESSRALRWTIDAASAGHGEVVAVHAFQCPIGDHSPAEFAALAQEAKVRFEQEWCAPLTVSGVSHRSVFGTDGARSAIRAASAEERPAFVALGSRGLGGLSRKVTGSVTQDLLDDSEWPVVVVPGPRDRPILET